MKYTFGYGPRARNRTVRVFKSFIIPYNFPIYFDRPSRNFCETGFHSYIRETSFNFMLRYVYVFRIDRTRIFMLTVGYDVFHVLAVFFGHATQRGEREQSHGETGHSVYQRYSHSVHKYIVVVSVVRRKRQDQTERDAH